MMRTLWAILGMMVTLALMGGRPAAAESPARTLSPYFFVEGADDGQEHFPLKSTSVKVVITGVIADVRVTQQYANLGTAPINARYVFPASTRAAVHGMTMHVGEDVIRARIKERKAAKVEFVRAKAAGKSASLLEQQRPNVFSMDVANIMPGETVRIELHYSELLVPVEGTYAFVYPTVVGPRYSTIHDSGADSHQQWLRNPYLKSDHPPTSSFNMAVTLAAGMPISQLICPSHKTHVAWQGKSRARITLAPGETDSGNRDFILDYRLDGDAIQTGLLLQKGGKENFFLLMAQPPRRVTPESLPPREYIFVLDVSGSMAGFPLDTAKSLMTHLLSGLRPEDRFNLVLFAGAARVLSPRSLPAKKPNLKAALALINGQRGGGGTELAHALESALAIPRVEGAARTLVVITDGYIAAEKEVFERIADQAGKSNVFAFGIGTSVNRYLIEGLARAGQGEPFVVTASSAAAAAAERFRRYIEAPVLTGIRVDFSGFDAYDVAPVHPADLFSQRPLVICGKWRGEAKGGITLAGATGAGPYTAHFNVSQAVSSGVDGALPYLWARERLGRLTDFSPQTDDENTRAQVTRLGIAYSMLTPYTSFVAVQERVRNPAAPARDVDQPLPLPQHVSNLAVGGRNVPEPGLGLLLALTGLAALLWTWRHGKKKIS
jgi:Ca-activated chloride channel family protein